MIKKETIDAHVNRIKQVAVVLNYGEPQILKWFKNTLPSKLYWVLFSINNFRDAIDTVKSADKGEDRQTTIRIV